MGSGFSLFSIRKRKTNKLGYTAGVFAVLLVLQQIFKYCIQAERTYIRKTQTEKKLAQFAFKLD